jgi:hypothetical protein
MSMIPPVQYFIDCGSHLIDTFQEVVIPVLAGFQSLLHPVVLDTLHRVHFEILTGLSLIIRRRKTIYLLSHILIKLILESGNFNHADIAKKLFPAKNRIKSSMTGQIIWKLKMPFLSSKLVRFF